jgi:hypothetical protein
VLHRNEIIRPFLSRVRVPALPSVVFLSVVFDSHDTSQKALSRLTQPEQQAKEQGGVIFDLSGQTEKGKPLPKKPQKR